MTEQERLARVAKRAALEKAPFTEEEKKRWAKMMHMTWHAIGSDCGQLGCRITKSLIVELVCDANRIEEYGGMTRAEYDFLGVIYNQPRFQRWARKEMNYA